MEEVEIEEEQGESPFHLLTDEPRELFGQPLEAHCRGRSMEEQERACAIIPNMAEFCICYGCLLRPTFDLDKHVSAFIKNRACPYGKVVNANNFHKSTRTPVNCSAGKRAYNRAPKRFADVKA